MLIALGSDNEEALCFSKYHWENRLQARAKTIWTEVFRKEPQRCPVGNSDQTPFEHYRKKTMKT